MHGAAGECRVRDVYYESEGTGVSRQTIEASINAADAEAYRIFIGDIRLGGVVIKLDEHERGYVDMLFVSPRTHDCGIGSAAWEAIERLHPQIRVWETVVPYCEKKNIRFYVNRCGFHIVELLNSRFPNPYSKHPNEAMLFMEQLADCMSRDTLYCVDPSLNEPVRNSYYEEAMREFNESLKTLKDEYESAEEANKQDLEAQIREQEASIVDYEQTSWDISQASIEWYRANDENIVLEGVNWLYSENAGEASDLAEQYLAGQIDVDAMLKAIDKKVNMMRMEGN